MTYIRKRSIRLRHLAAKRHKTRRGLLRNLDLSLTIEFNLVFLKIALTVSKPDTRRRE